MKKLFNRVYFVVFMVAIFSMKCFYTLGINRINSFCRHAIKFNSIYKFIFELVMLLLLSDYVINLINVFMIKYCLWTKKLLSKYPPKDMQKQYASLRKQVRSAIKDVRKYQRKYGI